MKEYLNAFVFLLLMQLVCSCTKEENEQSQHILKRKTRFSSLESTTPVFIWDYHYDQRHRLTSIATSNYSKENFLYDSNDQLVYKNSYSYAGDSIGWYLSDSTAFLYENGKLSTELQFQFLVIIRKVKYLYSNERLIKKVEFQGDQFSQLTIFEYDSVHCIKEIMCHDSVGNNPILYTYHTYDKKLLSRTESFLMNVRPLQKVNYYYSKNDLLITEESIQLDEESPIDLNYVYRYEYY